MNLLSSALLVLFDFIIFTKAEKCNCLDKSECFSKLTNGDWDFLKDYCFGGCEPGWKGLNCDRIQNTPCHCSNKLGCQLSHCASCEHGWYGSHCDKKKTYTIHRNTGNSHDHDSQWNSWDVFGYALIGIVIFIIVCCCLCTGVKYKNRQESSQTPATRRDPMWRTESSGGSQTYNLNRNIAYSVSNTNMMHSHNVQSSPFDPHSGSAPFSEPPPSYESIMSRDNIGIPKACNIQKSSDNQ